MKNAINKAMSGQRSIRNFVFAVTGTVLLVLVVLYSFVSLIMMDRGGLAPIVWTMDQHAQQFQKEYRSNPNAALPRDDYITTHLNLDHFPAEKRAIFAVREPGRGYQQIQEGGHSYIAGVIPMHNGEQLYLLFQDRDDELSEDVLQFVVDTALLVIPFFLVSVVLVMFVVALMTWRFLRPIKKLEHWATQLSLDTINEPIPSFTFRELNAVAKPLQQAFERIDTMLRKEQFLIRTTSHELRTPIAVIATNIELLKRMLKGITLTSGGKETIQRVERATSDMQKITETVLWLGRDADEELEQSWVVLGDLVEELLLTNNNLIESKKIQLIQDITSAKVKVAQTPCKITVSNILRNALQYTHEGKVCIAVRPNELQITNQNITHHTFDKTGSDYGFGLGLALVERICRRMNWYYRNDETPGGRDVVINFARNFSET